EWEHCKSTSRLIDKLKRDGYKIFAIEQDKKSIPYYKIKTTISSDSAILQDSAKKISNIKINSKFRMVLILGNEVKGLPKSILKKSDKILEIPMKGVMVRQAHHPHHIGHGKESLNVAVAFGIIAFHFADYHQ
ncbi:MAG: TrmH family RNA methyltransferase, partial [Patescibacteria group bacterium]